MMLNHQVDDIAQVSDYEETYLQTIRVPFSSTQISIDEAIRVALDLVRLRVTCANSTIVSCEIIMHIN